MFKKFIINDEATINSYGFRILTAGISLSRFLKNPICLNNHYNSTDYVLGTWEGLEVKEGQLLGLPKFNTQDSTGLEVVRKVEEGVINSCSMGIMFDKNNLKKTKEGLVLEQCELYEVSIVAVPSNPNAVRLFNAKGEEYQESEIQQLCLQLQENLNFKTMNKIKLSMLAFAFLGFSKNTTEVDEVELDEAVLKMKSENDAKSIEIENLKKQLKAHEEADQLKKDNEIETMVSLAIQEGRITAEHKQTYIDLAHANFDLAKNTLHSFAVKTNVAGGIKKPAGKDGEPMTEDKFQKLSLAEQLEWKEANPEEYKKLFA